MTHAPEDGLRFGRLGPKTVHLCIDMQNLFAEATPWPTPAMKTILPHVLALVRTHAAATIFTRFAPARRPEEASSAWQRYDKRWREVTLEQFAPGLVELMPQLAALLPPAEIVDKTTYSRDPFKMGLAGPSFEWVAARAPTGQGRWGGEAVPFAHSSPIGPRARAAQPIPRLRPGPLPCLPRATGQAFRQRAPGIRGCHIPQPRFPKARISP